MQAQPKALQCAISAHPLPGAWWEEGACTGSLLGRQGTPWRHGTATCRTRRRARSCTHQGRRSSLCSRINKSWESSSPAPDREGSPWAWLLRSTRESVQSSGHNRAKAAEIGGLGPGRSLKAGGMQRMVEHGPVLGRVGRCVLPEDGVVRFPGIALVPTGLPQNGPHVSQQPASLLGHSFIDHRDVHQEGACPGGDGIDLPLGMRLGRRRPWKCLQSLGERYVVREEVAHTDKLQRLDFCH